MGNIRLFASSLFALTTLVACGDDGGTPMIVDSGIVDAPPVDNAPPIDQPPPITYDFSCYQNAAPTTIATTVTVSGTAQEVSLATQSLGPAAGVTVRACKGDCTGADDLGAAPVTTANGNFTTPTVATNGAAIDAYGKATKNGSWTTYIYPHAPLTDNLSGAPVLLLTQTLINFLPQLTGGEGQMAGNGIVGVAATDCATPPVGVTGATVAVMSGSAAVGDDPYDVGALLGEDAAGVYLFTNVPPGTVSVTATYVQDGTTYTFLVNDAVGVFADSLTEAQIRPGY